MSQRLHVGPSQSRVALGQDFVYGSVHAMFGSGLNGNPVVGVPSSQGWIPGGLLPTRALAWPSWQQLCLSGRKQGQIATPPWRALTMQGPIQ